MGLNQINIEYTNIYTYNVYIIMNMHKYMPSKNGHKNRKINVYIYIYEWIYANTYVYLFTYI